MPIATNNLREPDIESDLATKRNNLREQLSKLAAEASALRGNIALNVCRKSSPDQSIVFRDLNGFVSKLKHDSMSKLTTTQTCTNKSSTSFEPGAVCVASGGSSSYAASSFTYGCLNCVSCAAPEAGIQHRVGESRVPSCEAPEAGRQLRVGNSSVPSRDQAPNPIFNMQVNSSRRFGPIAPYAHNAIPRLSTAGSLVWLRLSVGRILLQLKCHVF